MRLHATLATLALSVFALSCKDMPTDPWTTELPAGATQLVPDSLRNSAFRVATLSLPQNTPFVSPTQLVVRNQDEWLSLWEELRTFGGGGDGPPEVDFTTEMVIAVGIGTTPPPGDRLAIVGVMESGGQLFVLLQNNLACIYAAGGSSAARATAPVALALVPARSGELKVLERRIASRGC